MNSKPREPRHCQKWFMRRRMELVSVLNFDGHRSLFINIYPNLTHVLRGEGSRCTYIYIYGYWHFGILARGCTSACGGPQTLRLLGRHAKFGHAHGLTTGLSLLPVGVTIAEKQKCQWPRAITFIRPSKPSFYWLPVVCFVIKGGVIP